MSKKTSKLIWSVRTSDKSYPSDNQTWLLEGASAAVVEAKALKLAIAIDLLPGEPRSKPYIRSIEFVGELQG